MFLFKFDVGTLVNIKMVFMASFVYVKNGEKLNKWKGCIMILFYYRKLCSL